MTASSTPLDVARDAPEPFSHSLTLKLGLALVQVVECTVILGRVGGLISSCACQSVLLQDNEPQITFNYEACDLLFFFFFCPVVTELNSGHKSNGDSRW